MAWHQTDQLQRTACRDGNERCGDNPKAVGQQFSENTRAAVVGSMEYHGDEVRLGMHAKVGGQAPSQARNLLRQLGRAIDERFGAQPLGRRPCDRQHGKMLSRNVALHRW
jgi:hypothetical protein